MNHYLLIYDLAPDYLERRPDFRATHLALAWRYADEGSLVLGGPVGDPVESALLLFNDADKAAAFAGEDPYVLNGWCAVGASHRGSPLSARMPRRRSGRPDRHIKKGPVRCRTGLRSSAGGTSGGGGLSSRPRSRQ